MSFTAHNIRLDDGTETCPGKPLIADLYIYKAAERCLRMLYPGGFEGVRIADLACLEGGYSVAFARLGLETVGIEVRSSNMENCRFVKERVDLPNLQFVQDDAWNLEAHGPFDVIFCCGLLYHFDRPRAFLDLMGRCARKAVIINTHFSTTQPNPAYGLSELTENEGLPGRWFQEVAPRSEDARWASWENERSFWIQREYLLAAINWAGFPIVFEQYDLFSPEIISSLLIGTHKTDERSMFVGVKV